MEAILRMALIGTHERMTARARVRAGHLIAGRRRPSELRAEAQALAEKIAQNSPAAMAATKRALWGALEAGLTDACRAGAAQLVSMWGHPDQEEGPRAFAEKRDARVGDRLMTYPELETLKLERVGPVGWLINNRPEQLNAMNALMRDEFEVGVEGARRRPRGPGDRAHR